MHDDGGDDREGHRGPQKEPRCRQAGDSHEGAHAAYAVMASAWLAGCGDGVGSDSPYVDPNGTVTPNTGATGPENAAPPVDGTVPPGATGIDGLPLDPSAGGPGSPSASPTMVVGPDGTTMVPVDPPVTPVSTNCEEIQPGRAPLRRLTRFEYNNTVADLLESAVSEPANALPPELLGNGFGNDVGAMRRDEVVDDLAAPQPADVSGPRVTVDEPDPYPEPGPAGVDQAHRPRPRRGCVLLVGDGQQIGVDVEVPALQAQPGLEQRLVVVEDRGPRLVAGEEEEDGLIVTRIETDDPRLKVSAPIADASVIEGVS